MKKIVFLMMVMGLLNVLFINQASAQSCCEAKASCQKMTGVTELVKQEQAKQTCSDQAKSKTTSLVTATPVTALAGPAGMYSASYLFSQFGALISKMAGKIKSNDPCCVAKGCDPSACDVSHCDPRPCNSTAKN